MKEYAVHSTTFNNYFLVTRFGLPVSEYFNTRGEAEALAAKLNGEVAVYVNEKGEVVYA